VKKVRALNLAISAAQADTIAAKALNDLKLLRHSGLVSLGTVLGVTVPTRNPAPRDRATLRSDPAHGSARSLPVLLAPRLYAVVARMSELATQLSDRATTELTAPAATPAPTTAPSPSRTPTPSASPSARP
jgi:hypothetical protein